MEGGQYSREIPRSGLHVQFDNIFVCKHSHPDSFFHSFWPDCSGLVATILSCFKEVFAEKVSGSLLTQPWPLSLRKSCSMQGCAKLHQISGRWDKCKCTCRYLRDFLLQLGKFGKQNLRNRQIFTPRYTPLYISYWSIKLCIMWSIDFLFLYYLTNTSI